MASAQSSFGERVRARFGRLVLGAPAPIVRRLAGQLRVEEGVALDPQHALLLRLMEISRVPEMCEMTPAAARAFYLRNAGALDDPPRQVRRVEELAAPGPGGAIPMRLYVPNSAGPRPGLLVWYHGGGFVIGSLDSHDAGLRLVADEARCLVLSVDYRLAPEHKFPAAVDDAVAALGWAQEHAADLGADPARVAVAGDSAGGNLAAVVAQLTRAGGELGRPPCFQLLVYPATDLSRSTASHRTLGAGLLLTRRLIDWFVDQYVSSPEEIADPRASPLAARDLSGLAPAAVVVAGFDPLRDEGRAYARRLREAGVPTQLVEHPALVHGFITTTALPAARAASVATAALIRERLA